MRNGHRSAGDVPTGTPVGLKTEDTQSRAGTSAGLTHVFGRAAPPVLSEVGRRGEKAPEERL